MTGSSAGIWLTSPQAVTGDCSRAFPGLPQDVQGRTGDHPAAVFAKRVCRIGCRTPGAAAIFGAEALLRGAARPVVIAGGVHCAGAVQDRAPFDRSPGIPCVETIAGHANTLANRPLNTGPIGVTGSDSANAIAGDGDAVLASGPRLQDFTTGSWAVLAPDARLIGLNVGRHDAARHVSLPVVGNATPRVFVSDRVPDKHATLEAGRAPQRQGV